MDIKAIVDRYILELQKKNPATLSQLYRFILFFSDMDTVSKEDVMDYIIARRPAVKPSTLNREITIMKQLFRWMLVRGYIDKDPSVGIKYESGVAKRVRHITTEEEGRLISECPAWLQPIIQFATSTGMRRGEIVGLLKSDVNLNDKTATIRTSKNGEPRVIPLTKRALDAVAATISKGDRLFGGKNGEPIVMSNLEYNIRSAANRAGIHDLHFHDMRHTFATRLVRAGVDLYAVQCLLGHKGPAMTQRYSHHDIGSLRKATESVM